MARTVGGIDMNEIRGVGWKVRNPMSCGLRVWLKLTSEAGEHYHVLSGSCKSE